MVIILLKVKNLYKSYTTNNIKYDVLKGLSFQVHKGELVAIMGSSGSGKTTLLNCISCFTSLDQGKILLNETNISNLKESSLARLRNKKLGFVFQDFMLLDGLTIFENICLPQIIADKKVTSMEAATNKLCDIFGISHIKNKYPTEVSGGEKQRTSVARALINNPFLILADEPTGNLDSKSSETVIDAFIQAKNKLSATILMVTHDSFSASFCDRVIVMKDGKIYKELKKETNRSEFLDLLLKTLKELGGDINDHE